MLDTVMSSETRQKPRAQTEKAIPVTKSDSTSLRPHASESHQRSPIINRERAGILISPEVPEVTLTRSRSGGFIGKTDFLESNVVISSRSRSRNEYSFPGKSEATLQSSLAELYQSIVKHTQSIEPHNNVSSQIDWVEIKETEQNMIRDENGKIIAGTPEMIVQYLCGHEKIDIDFIDLFLGTYRSFLTPISLFELLLRIFFGHSEDSIEKRMAVRYKVHFVVRRWIETHRSDFDNSEYMTSVIQRFIKCLETENTSILAAQLERSLDEPQKRFESHQVKNAPLPRIPPLCCSWLDVDDLELARQLTLCESELYSNLQRTEFFNCAWAHPKFKHLSPNVVAEINRFNLLSQFVASEIVKVESMPKRVSVMEKTISVMEHLLTLNNFNTLMAFLSGIRSSPVYRLKKTKAQLSKQAKQNLERIVKLLSDTGNHKSLRLAHERAIPPKLPFLGMHLSDLVFISQGIPNSFNQSNLINFEKHRKEHKVIEIILHDQKFPYNLHPIPRVQQMMKDLQVLDDSNLVALSFRNEPKN